MAEANVLSLLGSELQVHTPGGGTETRPTAEVIKDKIVGIYFSAHWCDALFG